jgi:hypothetical protein
MATQQKYRCSAYTRRLLDKRIETSVSFKAQASSALFWQSRYLPFQFSAPRA